VFDAALHASGVKDILPQDALHVGDDVEKDYRGARAAGWNALLYVDKPIKSPEVLASIEPKHVALNLEQLTAK
jgi:FMN phosphatase YigB (HAD superfamily)